MRGLVPPLLAALAMVGCVTETRSTRAQAVAAALGLPAPQPARVALLAERDGRYLDARVELDGSELRFFFPASSECRAVLTGPGPARYSSHGLYGRLHRGEQHCDPVGLLSLAAWRDRRPRSTTGRSPVPRDASSYRIVYSDDDVVLARGRFQLAGLVGWPGGHDTIAVFPQLPECQGILDRGHATMEYREAGPQPLVLLDAGRRCPFLGFAMVGLGDPASPD